MRLTEYHCGKAVLKNKDLDSKAAAKLAAYEDLGYSPEEFKDAVEVIEKAVKHLAVGEFIRVVEGRHV